MCVSLPPHADDGIRKALATARERGRGAAVAPPPMSYPRGVGAPAIVVCTASVPKQLKVCVLGVHRACVEQAVLTGAHVWCSATDVRGVPGAIG